MKMKELIIASLIGALVIVAAHEIAAQSQTHEQLKNFYETSITQKIAKCQSKYILLNKSRSENLRQTAETSEEKSKFLMLNKSELADEMIDQGMGQKNYKIEQYLNSRFYELHK
jgi:hypothetical protein